MGSALALSFFHLPSATCVSQATIVQRVCLRNTMFAASVIAAFASADYVSAYDLLPLQVKQLAHRPLLSKPLRLFMERHDAVLPMAEMGRFRGPTPQAVDRA